ncbi:MAG: hypothetical protein RQ826_02605 [Xanthomonadales bacterium]|nr:hypothetical protein [Xanthomonadales bacterium]
MSLSLLATAVCGVLAWFLLPDAPRAPAASGTAQRRLLRGTDPVLHSMSVVLRRPLVWAQAAVIVCAYSAFKGLDNYSLYALQVLGMDEVEAARLTAWAASFRRLNSPAASCLNSCARSSRTT